MTENRNSPLYFKIELLGNDVFKKTFSYSKKISPINFS